MGDAVRPSDLASARRRAVTVCLIVFAGFGAAALMGMVDRGAHLDALAVGAALLLAMLALQIVVLRRPEPSPHRAVAILLLQAGLTYGPLAVFGEIWIGMPGFLAGTLLLYARPRWGWTGFGGVVLVAAAVQTLSADPQPLGVVYVGLSTALTGLVSWGLLRLTHALHQLDAAHRDLAAAAVVEERLRLARDVHDILGSGLSAIILKTELAHRLVTRDTAAADVELTETLAIARRALTDVRATADGFADLSLHEELRLARSILEGAGVRVTVDAPDLALSTEASSTIGTAVREAVANALRHATPTACRIRVVDESDRVTLSIANDGVGIGAPVDHGRFGTGLRNLAARFTALGGDFRGSRARPDWFEVTASLPCVTGPAPVPDPTTDRTTADRTTADRTAADLTAADVASAAARRASQAPSAS